MNFICPNLAVCGFGDIGTRDQFLHRGLQAQLQCPDALDPRLAGCVEGMALPFADAAPIPANLFAQSQAWLASHWDQGNRILISCAAGIRRSATMADSLLVSKGGLTYLEAIEEVMAKRLEANPNSAALASASLLCG